MSDDLYNAAILRLKLAGETVHRLPAADGSATRVSPVCGSKIIADVALGPDGRIVAAGLMPPRLAPWARQAPLW